MTARLWRTTPIFLSRLLALVLGVSALVAAATATQAQTPVRRIANGVQTQAWPELAAVSTPEGFCSGTLIGCRTVLTAGHCICSPVGPGPACNVGESLLDPDQIVVYLPQGGTFGVRDIEVPPTYQFAVSSDVALLHLTAPVRGLLPRTLNTQARPPLGTAATLLGYGMPEETAGTLGILREGAISTTGCGPASVPGSEHLCWRFDLPAEPPGSQSNICSGDSGGPLLADLGMGLQVAGVHSGGVGDCDLADVYGFDADVFVERAWIEAGAGSDLDGEVCGSGPRVGEPGVSTLSFDGVTAQEVRSFGVAVGTKLLRVGLNGGSDLDLYLRFGSPPTTSVFDCSSAFSGSLEYCEIEDPAPGTWHALIDSFFDDSLPYQLTATLVPENPTPPALGRGDLVVADFRSLELFQTDRVSGERTIGASSLRGTGPPLSPEGIAADADGSVVVANPFQVNLLRVDPATGTRSVISGCADVGCTSIVGTGPDFRIPRFVAVAGDGTLWVTDRTVPGVYSVYRVEPGSGNRTLISGCTDAACNTVVGSGPAIARLLGIAIEPSGDLLVADTQAVLRILPGNGTRSILSGCTDESCTTVVGPGLPFGEPIDLVVTPDGELYVTDGSEESPFSAVFRVDRGTGARSVVSGCANAACTTSIGSGPDFSPGLFGIGLGLGGGDLIVGDTGLRAVFVVARDTGHRTVVSGCAGPACVGTGTEFFEPIDVVVVPSPDGGAATLTALAALATVAGRRGTA